MYPLDPMDVSKLAALAYALSRHGDSQAWKKLINSLQSELAKQVARVLLSGDTSPDPDVEAIAKDIRHWARNSRTAR